VQREKKMKRKTEETNETHKEEEEKRNADKSNPLFKAHENRILQTLHAHRNTETRWALLSCTTPLNWCPCYSGASDCPTKHDRDLWIRHGKCLEPPPDLRNREWYVESWNLAMRHDLSSGRPLLSCFLPLAQISKAIRQLTTHPFCENEHYLSHQYAEAWGVPVSPNNARKMLYHELDDNTSFCFPLHVRRVR
jgi:hypothetical protein